MNDQLNLFDFEKKDEVLEEIKKQQKKYTNVINIPQYEIKGICPTEYELIDQRKFYELLKNIDNSNVTDEQKKFLKLSATRHLVFNYSLIAEYYAHQNKEMQELMEQSALVIIDLDNAIKYGFANLMEKLNEIEEEDYILQMEGEENDTLNNRT